MIITTELFIDEIYTHLQKICLQNKTTLPPRDEATIQKLTNLVDSSIHEIDLVVLTRTKKNIYKEWKKDQKGFLYVHKGFHTSFRFALEQSIPRSLDQIHQECPGLNVYLMERLGKINKQHYRWFKEEMVFQKGTAEFVHTYGRFIPTGEFLFRTNSALRKSRSLEIPEIERWSYVSGSLWDYLNFHKIEVNKSKIEHLNFYPIRKMHALKLNPFDAMDFATDE
jgi:hypothetical protein